MATKRRYIEDELSRFEAEISKQTSQPARNLFVPSQVRPIIAANTYNQVQQKLQQHPQATTISSTVQVTPRVTVAPPVIPPPTFMSTFVPTQVNNTGGQLKAVAPSPTAITATPVVVSSAPKLYQSRQSVNVPATPHIDINAIQFDVTQKLKKLKAEKSGPNPIAEEAIKAARASSALQSFQTTERKKKDRKTIRVAGGTVWEDSSLADWPDDDFRIFCGDLGNDVNDEVLTRTFNKYPSFQRARVIRDKRTGKSKGFGFVSFREPADFIRAMKEMDGRYVGSRPIKLRKSTWKQRSLDIVKKKEREKQQLLQSFNS
ncbi:RNA-binding protein 42 [Bactrocera neohumeralis]|uniref:RNA-binding protein 42 n=1 Tax=Bactrocera tryoni TaxID=59916 RepID=UPI001A97A11C|nr:RNA-binding protein 42 [Bactrocera tryoni]XP_050326442.1 RNA-binding protein 42 [Bactrocera neohumeralis]